MECYELDVLGLSETKVRGNGTRVIDGAKYVYAGVTEGRARVGMGIVVAERWAEELRGWRCMLELCNDQIENRGYVDDNHTGVCPVR